MEIKALEAQPFILACRTERRSADAAAAFRDAGFGHGPRDGFERCDEAGLPVER